MNDHPYKKILVAVDGTFHSSVAARYSCQFAQAFHSKLYVVTVISNDMNEKAEKAVSFSIAKIIDETKGSGLDIEGVILKGDIIGTINKFVRENKIDIVFSSTRRPQKEGRFFVKSVTSGLMSGVSCNMIAIKISHPGRSLRSKRVLVPVIGDGHMDRERADIVGALADRFSSSITVFHVNELSASKIKRLEKPEKGLMIEEGEKKISSFMKELSARGMHASEKIVSGSKVRDEIISEASHHKYDLIILGTTKRNILKKVVSGNPVEEILRDTPCDVMLLHFR